MSAKRRGRRRSGAKTNSASTTTTPEPKFIKPCNQLLNQITAMDDCKPFRQLLATKDKLYREYRRLNPNPISFKTIHQKLHRKPSSDYKSYEEFNKDVHKIFSQEQRLAAYKGSNSKEIKKRMQMAKRMKNYWETLTAPYTQYGFDAVINHKGSDNEEDDDNQLLLRPNKVTKKPTDKQQHLLSNIKKRVKRGEASPIQSTNKRRKLNDESAERISSDKPPLLDEGEDQDEDIDDDNDDDDAKKHMDDDQVPLSARRKKNKYIGNEYDEDDMKGSQLKKRWRVDDDEEDGHNNNNNSNSHNHHDWKSQSNSNRNGRDTPFTPFAEKSRIFNQMIGTTDDLFQGLAQSDPTHGIKKRLDFYENDNRNRNRIREHKDSDHEDFVSPRGKQYQFEVKYKNPESFRSPSIQYVDIEAAQMDKAVGKFRMRFPNCKILTVKLKHFM